MSNWKTTTSKLLASASLLMMPLSTVSAYDNCGSYDPCCAPSFDCCGCGWGNFSVGVDFLWWKPLVDDLDYGYSTNFDSLDSAFDCGVVQYQAICPKWEPGVRVGLLAPNVLCNWDALASFTWIRSRNNNNCSSTCAGNEGCVVNTLLHPIVNTVIDEYTDIRQISACWQATYYNADLLLGYKINMNPCLDITPYFGIAGIYLKQRQDGSASNGGSSFYYGYNGNCPLARSSWDVNYWGVGLEMGSSVEQRCCDCLSVFANANATLLAGKISKATNQISVRGSFDYGPIERACDSCDNDCDSCNNSCGNGCNNDCYSCNYSTLTFKDSGCGSFVPGYHIQAGFKYASNACGCNYAVRLGYEFLYWLNLPNPRRFDASFADDVIGPCSLGYSSGTNERTFGFHGLFLGAEFSF